MNYIVVSLNKVNCDKIVVNYIIVGIRGRVNNLLELGEVRGSERVGGDCFCIIISNQGSVPVKSILRLHRVIVPGLLKLA